MPADPQAAAPGLPGLPCILPMSLYHDIKISFHIFCTTVSSVWQWSGNVHAKCLASLLASPPEVTATEAEVT